MLRARLAWRSSRKIDRLRCRDHSHPNIYDFNAAVLVCMSITLAMRVMKFGEHFWPGRHINFVALASIAKIGGSGGSSGQAFICEIGYAPGFEFCKMRFQRT